MKWILVVTVLLAGWSSASYEQASSPHQHGAISTQTATLPIQRWIPDAPLREGMGRVRVAVATLNNTGPHDLSTAMVVKQAEHIDKAVLYMFDHCTLAAEPDTALHGILVPLMKAARTLKSTPHDRDAIDSMRAAVARYAQYFDDPGTSNHLPTAPRPRAYPMP